MKKIDFDHGIETYKATDWDDLLTFVTKEGAKGTGELCKLQKN